jgi:hypothetical protein
VDLNLDKAVLLAKNPNWEGSNWTPIAEGSGKCDACGCHRKLSLRIFPDRHLTTNITCGSECGPLLKLVYQFICFLKIMIDELTEWQQTHKSLKDADIYKKHFPKFVECLLAMDDLWEENNKRHRR